MWVFYFSVKISTKFFLVNNSLIWFLVKTQHGRRFCSWHEMGVKQGTPSLSRFGRVFTGNENLPRETQTPQTLGNFRYFFHSIQSERTDLCFVHREFTSTTTSSARFVRYFFEKVKILPRFDSDMEKNRIDISCKTFCRCPTVSVPQLI